MAMAAEEGSPQPQVKYSIVFTRGTAKGRVQRNGRKPGQMSRIRRLKNDGERDGIRALVEIRNFGFRSPSDPLNSVGGSGDLGAPTHRVGRDLVLRQM